MYIRGMYLCMYTYIIERDSKTDRERERDGGVNSACDKADTFGIKRTHSTYLYVM